MKDEEYNVLIPYYHNRKNGESEKAEALFKFFRKNGFSYDDISNHPDYLAYASARILLNMIPWIIDEMLRRKDTINYLIYPIIMSVDLQAYDDIPNAQEEVKKLISLADKSFAQKVCKFLEALKDEPPIPQEEFNRVHCFWKNKLQEL